MHEDVELENGHYDPSIRKELEQADWKIIFPKLIWFAKNQSDKFYWLGTRHFQPQDLVQEAISLAFGCGENGKYRNWNKDYYPDLTSFLKGVIKSIVSHEIEHIMEFPHNAIEPTGDKTSDFIGESAPEAKNIYDALSSNSPEDNFERNEIKKVLSVRVAKLKSLAAGDEEMELVMMCFDDGISTPREIAKATGYDVSRIYNIIKRIKRKIKNIKLLQQ
ncbi:MAG: hypothetical protein A4E71_02510 [Smithella sp. PtaU1.Bin162]|nr:MAG: hypothetical protein A4E71_02510 [Smithella sp. PtaU1.Bin162]